ncbi:MAG: general secretion pathway protein GspD, partial [Polaromonas sp.]|nr:general secretion pathway protein GspD [Polaromonas sp.]
PVITVTTSPTGGFAESINYVDVGLKLDVEPTIYRGNDIVIKLGLEVSNISGSQTSKLGGVAYTFGTRTVTTTLRLRDGENQVLAGLINDDDRKVANKIPAIGELPVVGRLFGSSLDDGKRSEIVLSITPRLVRNINRPEGSSLEFQSGTENSMRERPIATERSQPPTLSAVSRPGSVTVTPLPSVSMPSAAAAVTLDLSPSTVSASPAKAASTPTVVPTVVPDPDPAAVPANSPMAGSPAMLPSAALAVVSRPNVSDSGNVK